MNLNIAGASVHYNQLIKQLPILRLQNKKISFTVYEGPNLCQWNGGRINRNIILSKDMIEHYNRHNIAVSLTFTNPIIDINDKIGNELLEILYSSGKKYSITNKIVLVNDSFRKYLRSKYEFELIYSITGHPSDIILTKDMIEYYKDLELKYDYIVPKFELVFQQKFYESIDINKYELLINDSCRYGCKYYNEHFIKIAEQNTISKNPWEELGYDHCFKTEECWLTDFNPHVDFKENHDQHGELCGMNYTKDMIKKAISLGFNSFKISGRENSAQEILSDINRFIKDINC